MNESLSQNTKIGLLEGVMLPMDNSLRITSENLLLWQSALVKQEEKSLVEACQTITENEHDGATILLLNNFSRKAADILQESGKMNIQIVIDEAIKYNTPALSWLLSKGSNAIDAIEKQTFSFLWMRSKDGVSTEQIKNVENIRYDNYTPHFDMTPTLVRHAHLEPEEMLNGLIDADLPTLFKRKKETTPTLPNNLGVLTVLLQHPKKINEAHLLLLVERLLDNDVLDAVFDRYNNQEQQKERAAWIMHSLIMAAMKDPLEKEQPNTLALQRLDQLYRNSKKIAAAVDKYWEIDHPKGMNAGQKFIHTTCIKDPHRISRIISQGYHDVSKFRARNILDCLVMAGAPMVKQSLIEKNENTPFFWTALRRGANLHGFLRKCSTQEVLTLLPDLLENLGIEWRDGTNNNLVHVIAQATGGAEKKALTQLARNSTTGEMFHQKNQFEETPLEIIENDPEWKLNAPDYHEKLKVSLSKGRRDNLHQIANENATGGRKSSKKMAM